MLSDRDYVHVRYGRTPRHGGSVLMPLIIANAAVFLLQNSTGMAFTNILILRSRDLMRFEFWRLGTHMFAHGSFGHILMNMWGLYIFGKPVEERIGGHRFLYLYFISGLVGGGTWLLFNWHNPYGVIGASGAVFGVLMAAALMFPNRMYMMLFPPIPMRLKTLAAVFAGIEVLSLLSMQGGNIAHLAHLGGMLGGYGYIRWLFGASWHNQGSHWKPLSQLRGWWRRRRFRRVKPERDNDDHGPVSPNEVDRILDKIGEKGLSSLTRKERETLEKARRRMHGNRIK
jgi:membrane associated rhomboid family serine protease